MNPWKILQYFMYLILIGAGIEIGFDYLSELGAFNNLIGLFVLLITGIGTYYAIKLEIKSYKNKTNKK